MDSIVPFLIPDMTRIIIPEVEPDLIARFPFRQICLNKPKCIITCPTDSTITVPVAMVSTTVGRETDSTSTVPAEVETDLVIVPAEMEMGDTTAVPVEMDLVALPEEE